MSTFDQGLLVIGVLGALVVPLLLVATLPFSSGRGAHRPPGGPRGGREPPP